MSADPQLIDLSALRAKLLIAQRELQARCLEDDPALQALNEAIVLMNPRRDPNAAHPSVDKTSVQKAIIAAHELLLAEGVENPVEILIVQSHDDAGQTTGRSLASSAANPQDLLRVCLRNIEATNERNRARRDFLKHT